ncbi:MAG: NUDIX domain-containing protein [Coriobacteriia bacterium]
MAAYCYEYPRPALTVDAVAFAGDPDALSVLLIRRGQDPFTGRWALPGGFVDENERLEHAVRRELAEETGVEWGGLMRQVGTFGDPGRDPRGWTVSVGFIAYLGEELLAVEGGDDAVEAAWFALDALPEPLAFDHGLIIEAAVEALRSGGWTIGCHST